MVLSLQKRCYQKATIRLHNNVGLVQVFNVLYAQRAEGWKTHINTMENNIQINIFEIKYLMSDILPLNNFGVNDAGFAFHIKCYNYTGSAGRIRYPSILRIIRSLKP